MTSKQGRYVKADAYIPKQESVRAMEIPIPEDLKLCHELSEKYASSGLEGWSASAKIVELIERIAKAEQQCDEAEKANELDRRSLFAVVRAIDEEINGRMWLLEGQ